MLGKTHIATTGAIASGSVMVSYILYQKPPDIWGLSHVSTWLNEPFMRMLELHWDNAYLATNFLNMAQLGLMFHLIFLISTCCFGALLPDIDTNTSILGRYVPFIGAVVPHRTITHTLWAVLALGFPTYFINDPYLYALWFGYVLHIIEDSFSRQGIAWLYPFITYTRYGSGAVIKKGRNPKWFYYRTGSATEKGIYYAMCTIWFVFSVQFVYLMYFA